MKNNTPISRAIGLLFILQGHNYTGLRLTQIAENVNAQKSTVLRNLQALESAGAVERVPGREEAWRLSPRIVQLAIAHYDEVEQQNKRRQDFIAAYSRPLQEN